MTGGKKISRPELEAMIADAPTGQWIPIDLKPTENSARFVATSPSQRIELLRKSPSRDLGTLGGEVFNEYLEFLLCDHHGTRRNRSRFADRINSAAELGLVPDWARERLHAVRGVRNELSHDTFLANLDDTPGLLGAANEVAVHAFVDEHGLYHGYWFGLWMLEKAMESHKEKHVDTGSAGSQVDGS